MLTYFSDMCLYVIRNPPNDFNMSARIFAYLSSVALLPHAKEAVIEIWREHT